MKKNYFNINKNNIIKLFNEKKFNKISKISKIILEKFQNDTDLLYLIIISEINCNNLIKAENLTNDLLNIKKSKEIHYLLGNILKLQNKNEEAILAYKNSIELDETFSEAYNNLANVQKKINQVDEAYNNYEKAIKYNKKNLQAYFNLANLFRSEKKFDMAIVNFKNVINIDQNFAQAYSNIGQIYASLGNVLEAEKYIQLAIDNDEQHVESYKNYFLLKKVKENDKNYLKLKEIIFDDKIKSTEKQNMLHCLSKASFDIGKTQEGFTYLEKANQLKLREIKFSYKKIEKSYKRLIDIFSNIQTSKTTFFDKYNSYPIFILGMPRSGTSLLEQIISNHSMVYGGGELSLFTNTMNKFDNELDFHFLDALKKIRQDYLFNLNKLSVKKYITDKLPGNFKFIGIILESIPEAKIIHIERNPMAVCWSNYKSNFLNNNGMEYTLRQKDTAEFFISYNNIMKFWNGKFPEKIINIKYENLVDNFEIEVKNLFKNLNLKWEDQVLKFYDNTRSVETASFLQVRKNIYKNSSEEWKKYQNYLSPMIEILTKNNIKF
jgi:tetratricopeptide (TPR) repeat protein